MKNNKHLGISLITSTVYYGTVGIDKNGRQYWKTKTEVPKNDFIPTMISYIQQNSEDGVMTITQNGVNKYVVRLEELAEEETADGKPQME